MKPFFNPSDFAYDYTDEEKAATANAKLQKLIEASPVVYGMGDDRENFNKWKSPHHTHQALLMFIEPIVKKECEHAPSVETCIVRGDGLLKEFSTSGKCKHCGIELKATWEPVK